MARPEHTDMSPSAAQCPPDAAAAPAFGLTGAFEADTVALAVFLSLVFWGWVLGPAGMFLSVPLTMSLKIAFTANPQTYPIAIMLGPAVEARAAMAAGRDGIVPGGRVSCD